MGDRARSNLSRLTEHLRINGAGQPGTHAFNQSVEQETFDHARSCSSWYRPFADLAWFAWFLFADALLCSVLTSCEDLIAQRRGTHAMHDTHWSDELIASVALLAAARSSFVHAPCTTDG
jgi:hypothetical protein